MQLLLSTKASTCKRWCS